MNSPNVVVFKQQKSMAVAYLLLIFLGQLGIHRFYLNRVGSGIGQLLLGIVGWSMVWAFVGIPLLLILWVWLFVDVFLTANMVKVENAKLDILASRS